MSLLRELRAAYRRHREERYRAWLRRSKVILPLPKPDTRNWSDEYMRSLRHG